MVTTSPVVTIKLDTIADGAGRVGDRIDNSSSNKRVVIMRVKIKTDGSGATADSVYKFYLVRQDDDTDSHQDDAVGEVDAAVTTEPANSEEVGSIVLTNTADKEFETSFVFYGPGPFWSIVFWNASGQTTNVTAASHHMRFDYGD